MRDLLPKMIFLVILPLDSVVRTGPECGGSFFGGFFFFFQFGLVESEGDASRRGKRVETKMMADRDRRSSRTRKG